jgi:hypothetical protein
MVNEGSHGFAQGPAAGDRQPKMRDAREVAAHCDARYVMSQRAASLSDIADDGQP